MPDSSHEPFNPTRFARQIAIDQTQRGMMLAAAGLCIIVMLLMPGLGVISTLLAPVVVVGLWGWWSASTARVARLLNDIGPLIGRDPQQAFPLIEQALRICPIMPWARLLTYHRLASVYHALHRHTECASLCLCLINQPLKGPAAAVRSHLLLMLAEAQLERGDLPGAYHALAHLQQTRLSLTESLQRLAIQTRYELAVGAYDAAMRRSRAKVELAELMPAAHCATMHAMLATAAARSRQPRLADWLWERTRLLASPALLNKLEQGGFGIGVVQHLEPGA